MAATALVIEIVFFALAFGLRSVIQYRRTGSSGLRIPGPDASVTERIGGLGFVVAIILIVAAPVSAMAGWAPLDLPTWVHAAGLILAVTGTAATVWAQLDMGDSWRIGVDPSETTDLVTGGVYRRVRNPIFTAMIASSIGLALTVPSWISISAVLVLVAALEVQVRAVEEPYLTSIHGPAYLAYRRTAGRFLPGVGTGP